MVSNATALFPYDYYPHTDTYDAGFRAAECMDKNTERRNKSYNEFESVDLLLPYMPTSGTEMERYVKLAQSMRKLEKYTMLTYVMVSSLRTFMNRV